MSAMSAEEARECLGEVTTKLDADWFGISTIIPGGLYLCDGYYLCQLVESKEDIVRIVTSEVTAWRAKHDR